MAYAFADGWPGQASLLTTEWDKEESHKHVWETFPGGKEP